MTVYVDDAAVLRDLEPADAVRWMGEAIDAHHRGELIAPPRVHADFGAGRLVFTTGRLVGSWYGYRSYDSFPNAPGCQVVVVHDERSGSVRAVALGNELGPRRTGAIGGVAAAALSRADSTIAAVIGAGTQAATQLWALAAVRDLDEIRVYSRDERRRTAFAKRTSETVGVACIASPDPRTAVEGADIVVLATSSGTPVIQADWLGDDCYVTTLGPKQRGRAEFGLDLAERADVIATDSPAQLADYDPPNVLVGTGHEARLVSLGAVRAGEVDVPASGRRVFFSVGLAGTEAFLLGRLAARTDSMTKDEGA